MEGSVASGRSCSAAVRFEFLLFQVLFECLTTKYHKYLVVTACDTPQNTKATPLPQ